jgi:hypothetical protein
MMLLRIRARGKTTERHVVVALPRAKNQGRSSDQRGIFRRIKVLQTDAIILDVKREQKVHLSSKNNLQNTSLEIGGARKVRELRGKLASTLITPAAGFVGPQV